MLLEGIFPAITTPFYPDGRVYLKKLEHNVDRYSRTPAAGIVILGSTGEAVMLSDDDSRDVLRHAAHAASADKVLLAGVGRESVLETLRLAEYASDHQYDAILVRTPHYYGPQMNARALLAYYQTLADRSPVPVVLYSIPRFTHLEIPLEVVAELAQHPNIVAIKDSSGSLERLASLVEATRSAPKRNVLVTPVFAAMTNRMMLAETEANLLPAAMLAGEPFSMPLPPVTPPARTMRKKEVGFQVLSGAADSLLSALQGGASGAILAFAAPAPQACQEIYIAWKDNDTRIAEEKQRRIVDASRLVVGKLGIAGLKYACDRNGYYGGVPRIPLLPLDSDQKSAVDAAMAEIRN
jgi:4-hydroxy-2-oxoglutarate aldolase